MNTLLLLITIIINCLSLYFLIKQNTIIKDLRDLTLENPATRKRLEKAKQVKNLEIISFKTKKELEIETKRKEIPQPVTNFTQSNNIFIENYEKFLKSIRRS